MPKKLLIFLAVLSLITGFLGGFLYWTLSDLPNIKLLEEYTPFESSKVYSSDGKLLAEFYLERRTFIPHYQIPDILKKAFISVEDIRFYNHPGVDLIGILRALWHDIKAGGVVEGGSTITQQLARMLFLAPDKSIKRKIKEAAISIKIEKQYTKEEIIGMYLNQAYFGTRAYGIEAAAQTYFGKSVHELNLAEVALLAALPKAPSYYSPFKNREKALERRTFVLKQMLENNFITQQEYNEAVKVPLPETPHYRKYDAPYFIEMLRQELEAKYGNELYTGGLKIISTLDSRMQSIAEDAVKKGVDQLIRRVQPPVESALIAMDIRTGFVKAMVGGVDFWKNQYNRATQALRQPGSAFKPFVYMAAIENGMTADSVINDSPVSFAGARAGQRWIPTNYDGKYYGAVTLRTALAKSLNCATIRLAANLGVENVIEIAQRLGIKSKLQPYLPIAIGASDVTLLEMVKAYSTFANGSQPEPIFFERILNRDGVVIEEAKPSFEELLAEEDVEQMKELLKAVINEGTATRAREIKRTIYGKTGTTNNYTDAWFIGFDDTLVAGVWVGRDDHKSLGPGMTGSQAALPIWIEFMKKAPLQILQDQSPLDLQSPLQPQ
ncbi:MAG: PBP1A family penicillin-binding protein [Nitrospirae bacterium]|jgi:penicillin-binding protein 1A|nr:PBP1A family penicillin-binding protein [Nitrospirota bacterium]